MIPRGCFLKVIDNSGARLAQVIGFYGQQGQYGFVGDVVKVAVKDAKGEKVQAGTTKKAVITGACPVPMLIAWMRKRCPADACDSST